MRSRLVRPPHPQLIEFLEPFGKAVTRLALVTRKFVLEEEPAAFELIYDAYNAVSIAFSLSDRLRDGFCHVAVYSRYVNLGFNQGALLPDPKGLLEGTGRMIRHVRIEREEDLRDIDIRELLRLAVINARREATGPSNAKLPPQSIVKAIYPKKRRPKLKP